MFSYLLDLRCRHWNVSGTRYVPEDTRRDSSHAEFYADTFLLLLKHGLYIDAILAFCTNIDTFASQGGTIFRDTFAVTSKYSVRVPHPIIGALPLTIAIGLLLINGLEFENYAVTLLAAPLTILPPSISPHSRPASALKSEWPPLFDNPSQSTSLNEFWAKRWQGTPRRGFLVAGANPGRKVGGHVGQMLGKLVGAFSTSDTNAQKREARMRVLGSRIGYVMGAFLVSGLVHDLGMWGMGQGTDFRRVTGYFLIQGVGVIVERVLGLDKLIESTSQKQTSMKENASTANGDGHPSVRRGNPPSKVSPNLNRWLMKLWVFMWVVVPGTMMIEAWLKRGFDMITLVPSAYSPSRAILDLWNRYAFGQ
ncbi:membrane bound O-acyl transferase family protein [Ceratobasidium sp. AG-Ba]|nr:membrane bound O-acyl transferase family protein [Ceratobasidium sp. AG-Ba]QRW10714.1 membrane bound O-acyl transferase family protein [Ceratobasidium sp. AG-Ba]